MIMMACGPKRLLIGEDRDQEQNDSYFKGNRAFNKHTSPGLNLTGASLTFCEFGHMIERKSK